MGIAATVSAMLRRRGEAMVLKRAGTADITVMAKRYGVTAAAVVGSMADADLFIKISDEEIAASADQRAPRRGDVIGGYIVSSVDTRRDSGKIVVHILAVGGGQ